MVSTYAARFSSAGVLRLEGTAGETVALVGDAAGYLDPLTGEGLSLAFRSARALVDTIAAGAPLEQYERARALGEDRADWRISKVRKKLGLK